MSDNKLIFERNAKLVLFPLFWYFLEFISFFPYLDLKILINMVNNTNAEITVILNVFEYSFRITAQKFSTACEFLSEVPSKNPQFELQVIFTDDCFVFSRKFLQ